MLPNITTHGSSVLLVLSSSRHPSGNWIQSSSPLILSISSSNFVWVSTSSSRKWVDGLVLSDLHKGFLLWLSDILHIQIIVPPKQACSLPGTLGEKKKKVFSNMLPIVTFPSFHFVCVFSKMEKIVQRRWGLLIVDAATRWSRDRVLSGQGAESPGQPHPFPPWLPASFPNYREVSG